MCGLIAWLARMIPGWCRCGRVIRCSLAGFNWHPNSGNVHERVGSEMTEWRMSLEDKAPWRHLVGLEHRLKARIA
jgi:hypothetical protein